MSLLYYYNLVGVGYADIAEAGDTVSAAGALALAGTFTASEDEDSLSGSSALAILATLAATEPDDAMTTASTRRMRKILRNVTIGGHL